MGTYAAPGVAEADKVNAFGQVVERDFIGTRTVAPTTVVGGTPVTYGEPIARPATTVVGAPAVTEVDKVNAFGQVVERDFAVGGFGSRVVAPTYAAPATYAAPVSYGSIGRVVGAPGVTEVDKVNAFGQVVERDFAVGG